MIAGDCISTCPSVSSVGTNPCGLSAYVARGQVFLAAQIHRDVFVPQSFEVQRDAQSVGATARKKPYSFTFTCRPLQPPSVGSPDDQADFTDTLDQALDAVARQYRAGRLPGSP